MVVGEKSTKKVENDRTAVSEGLWGGVWVVFVLANSEDGAVERRGHRGQEKRRKQEKEKKEKKKTKQNAIRKRWPVHILVSRALVLRHPRNLRNLVPSQQNHPATMATKILRTANAPRTPAADVEVLVGQALLDLEDASAELKVELRPLQISSAREVDVQGGKKAIVIFVPMPQLKAFHKIQDRLTRELEKKFSDRQVVFIGQRVMLPKPSRHSRQKQPRPRSRTLKAVHDAILDDLVYPSEITGKRLRTNTDGSKLIRVFLDPKDATNLEYKLDLFSSVYRKLTGKEVKFEFWQADA